MPSFVARVERPDRGGDWVAYLQARDAAGAPLGAAARARPPSARRARTRRAVGAAAARRRRRGRAARRAAVRGRAACPRRTRASASPRCPATSAARCSSDLVGDRANRRHRPGRGFEALRYRFEIVSDYGAFRDLQRHRMLTVQWQTLTPAPRRGRARGGRRRRRRRRVPRARSSARAPSRTRLAGAGLEREALYALCLGYRIRYVLDLNAREAMQLIELRSGREGHPSYRAVAHEMHAPDRRRPPRRRRGDGRTSTATPSPASSASCPRCAPRPSSTPA